MTTHEQFGEFLETLHPDTRPEAARFLVTHSMVSEEAVMDLAALMGRDHTRKDADLITFDEVFTA